MNLEECNQYLGNRYSSPEYFRVQVDVCVGYVLVMGNEDTPGCYLYDIDLGYVTKRIDQVPQESRMGQEISEALPLFVLNLWKAENSCPNMK